MLLSNSNNLCNKKEKKIMHTTIKFAKVRADAIIPSKKDEDAGYDIYANFEEPYIRFEPHETKKVPTGIACACDINYCFEARERGSTGVLGLSQRSGIIDSGYRGEIFLPLTNTTNKTLFIAKSTSVVSEDDKILINGAMYLPDDIIVYPYTKAIAQLLLIPVPTADVEEYTYEELKAIPSSRGTGKLGSSGK